MARIRMIKPEFFDDPDVASLTPWARLFFIGLWTQADKEGRLVADMRRLKVRIFPYDEVDVEALAAELHGKNMIVHYLDAEKHGCIWVRNFTKHQRPHPKEPASLIPAYDSTAVERNGEPCKNISKPPESGSLILDSGVRKPARPPTLIRKRNLNATYEHPRFDVPQSWHDRRIAGLFDGERGLSAFYDHLAAYVDQHPNEDTEPRFDWLTKHFDMWVKARQPASETRANPDVRNVEETRRWIAEHTR